MDKIPYHAVTSYININELLYVIVWKFNIKILQIGSFVLHYKYYWQRKCEYNCSLNLKSLKL